MKGFIWVSFAIVLIISVTLGGCVAPAAAPAPSPAPKPSAPPAPASGDKPIVLKFAYDMPTTGAIVPGWEKYFGPELQTRSNGRVKVEFYGGAALFTQKDTPDSLKAGVADIANISLTNQSQLFPVNNIFGAPGMEFPDQTRDGYIAKYKAYLQLSQKYPILSKELADYKLLFWAPNPAYRIISKNKIAVPDDLKGVRLGSGNMQGQVTQLCGGVMVGAVPNDYYEAISKGIFDGAYASWAQVATYKFEEVANYFLDYGFTQEETQICMNLKTWNSLPQDIQKLIDDLAVESVGRCADSQIERAKVGMDNAKSKNRTIVTPTADQRALWDTAISPIFSDWVKNAQSKGMANATDLLNELKTIRAAAFK